MRTVILIALVAGIANAGDLEYHALQILAPGAAFEGVGGVRTGTTSGHTMEQVRAITNRADVIAAALAQDAAEAAPAEVDRVAYSSGWSEAVIDGASVVWRTHASPYNPAVDAANRQAALASNLVMRLELRDLRDRIATNINDVQAIDGTTAQQLAALRRELVDSNQTQRDVVRILRQMVRDE